nr:MoxR family ATPase [Lachnospiraceae bacterium]
MNKHHAADLLEYLRAEGVREELLAETEAFRLAHPVPAELADRVPAPAYVYYGKAVWEKALAALLCGENLLLSGPKASGKNVLAENLSCLFGRPQWDISFHINVDAAYLIGSDTFDGEKVVFRPGPVYLCALQGGFGVLDEINMARNEALAVLHAALDFRRVLDVPGYARVPLKEETRFIATMNYGYAGTRELNAALCSRFAVLDMPVIGEEDFRKLLKTTFPDLKAQPGEQFMRLFYDLERKAAAAEISDRALDLRGILDALRLMGRGLSSGDALDMCICGKVFDPLEQELIRDVIRARLPMDLTGAELFEETKAEG